MDLTAFVRRYAEESAERLTALDGALASLESNSADMGVIDELMRQAHTLKGGARMLRLEEIQGLAHAFEDAMTEVQAGKRTVTPELMDALFAATRGLRMLVEGLEETPPYIPDGLDVEAIAKAVQDGTVPPSSALPGAVSPPTEEKDGFQTHDTVTSETQILGAGKRKKGHSVRVSVSRLNALGNLTVEMTVEAARARRRHAELEQYGFFVSRARAASGSAEANSDVRHAFQELERLHRRLIESSEDELARRGALDTEVRDHVQALRLTPLKVVFDAFPASVREIARGFKKEVDLEITGGDAELDRRIVDEIGEPLVHLVRNSLDHGIESPEQREAAGKPRRGKLTISAWPAEGSIFIQVEDDGKGIDTDSIRKTAIRRGVLTEAEVERLSDAQVQDLIFMAGFSTKEVVTEISGRGVGMDSVRVALGRLGGTVSIESTLGKGTKIVCRLPLTLALLHVLLFRVAGEILAVPMGATEWVGSFESWGSNQYLGTEDELLPVVSMSSVLDFPDEWGGENQGPSFLVLRSAGARAMFVVDEVLEDTEVALKEPPPHLRHCRAIAGVTLLGSGEAAFVAEPSELLARALSHRVSHVEGGEPDDNGASAEQDSASD
ncbi:MAG: chemotaxis protein CheA [Planctomycetota bacterium]|jgi:chemotaxis protein histidine kinase CheA